MKGCLSWWFRWEQVQISGGLRSIWSNICLHGRRLSRSRELVAPLLKLEPMWTWWTNTALTDARIAQNGHSDCMSLLVNCSWRLQRSVRKTFHGSTALTEQLKHANKERCRRAQIDAGAHALFARRAGYMQLGICGILVLLAMSPLGLGILQIFFHTSVVIWWLQVLVLLGIFCLFSETNVQEKCFGQNPAVSRRPWYDFATKN